MPINAMDAEYIEGKRACWKNIIKIFVVKFIDEKKAFTVESTNEHRSTIRAKLYETKFWSFLFSAEKYPAVKPANVFAIIVLPNKLPVIISNKKP